MEFSYYFCCSHSTTKGMRKSLLSLSRGGLSAEDCTGKHRCALYPEQRKSRSRKFSGYGFIRSGGSMWELNPPERLLTPHIGFEDQEAHQHLSTPMYLFFALNHYIFCIPACQSEILKKPVSLQIFLLSYKQKSALLRIVNNGISKKETIGENRGFQLTRLRSVNTIERLD